jgi:hypothetical protein
MDVQELRAMFVQQATVIERMRQFVHDRVRIITLEPDRTPFQLPNAPKLVLHFLPLSSFLGNVRIDVEDIASAQSILQRPAFREFGAVSRPNLEGLLYPAPPNATQAGYHYYAQIFHTGGIEIVNAAELHAAEIPPILYPGSLENDLFTHLNWAERVYRRAQVTPPIYVYTTLIGASDYGLNLTHDMQRRALAHQGGTFGSNQFTFPDLSLQSTEADPPVFSSQCSINFGTALGISEL